MNFKNGTVVQIIWQDANGHSGWAPRKEYEELAPEPIMTVGCLLREDKDSITLVSSQSEYSCNQAIAIPKAWITARKTLAQLDNLGRDVSRSKARKPGKRP